MLSLPTRSRLSCETGGDKATWFGRLPPEDLQSREDGPTSGEGARRWTNEPGRSKRRKMAGVALDGPEQQRAASPPRAHIRHVEGLRAVAALVVFVNHAYAQTWNPDQGRVAPGLLSWVSYSLILGHLSVTVFIVVSGFCLAL